MQLQLPPNALVSIIINNYNYAGFLKEAIDSALNQTYPWIEAIVVDDGSTDHSQAIIRSYGNRIIPILKTNGGQASAINAGFAASSGDIIIILDADDYLLPQTVTRVVSVWEPSTAKVQYRLTIIDAIGKPLGTYPPQKLDSGAVWQKLLRQGRYSSPVTSGNAFHREVLQHLLPMPEAEFRIAADGYLITLSPFYGQIISIENPLGTYRIHGQNLWAMSKNQRNYRFHKFIQHDLQRYQLLNDKASELGLQPRNLEDCDYLHLKNRLLSLRFSPETHPLQEDFVLGLVFKGIWATYKYSQLIFKDQVLTFFWLMWVGLTPIEIAQLAISPSRRERLLTKLLRRGIRSFRHIVIPVKA
jgi:glycosyltransferase involved in cell wall biosynthesis